MFRIRGRDRTRSLRTACRDDLHGPAVIHDLRSLRCFTVRNKCAERRIFKESMGSADCVEPRGLTACIFLTAKVRVKVPVERETSH